MKNRYPNDEVTVIWKPELCIHSGICVEGLPNVFRPKSRPWVDVTAATTEELVAQVKRCPSGALSHEMNAAAESESGVPPESPTESPPDRSGP